MATRPIWRGHLKLALVSCPIGLWNAKHDRSTLKFNLINPDTGNRISMKTVDSETGDELERRDLVKGYEFRKDQYLLLKDTDFESVKVDSSSVMTIDKFVDAGAIDPIYYASSYYIAPDGEAGRDVYATLYRAIQETGRVALTRVVISQRERTVAIRAMNGGLVAHTLDEPRDLNHAGAIIGEAIEISPDRDMVALTKQLIDRQTTTYDPADLEDRYETRLRAMIDAKLKGEGIDLSQPIAPESTSPADLMAALKKSLGQEQATKATPKKGAMRAVPTGRGAVPPAAKPTRKRA